MRGTLALLFFLLALPCAAQTNGGVGATLPSTCVQGSIFVTTTNAALSVCTETDTWTTLPTSSGSIPSGLITLIASGTCPTGWAESSALNGKMLRGTVAANGNVGTTGGADTITPTVASLTAAAQTFTGSSATSSAVGAGTPAGTINTPTFTGAAWTPPALSWPAGVPTNAAITAGTPAGTVSALTTGADSSTTGGVAKAIAQTPTFTGSALGTHTHTISWPAGVPTIATYTPTGTISALTFTGSALGTHTHTVTATGTNGTSAVTGTLNSFDNRPAYINVIFCSKN